MIKWVCVIWILLQVPGFLYARNPIAITEIEYQWYLSEDMDLLEDQEGTLTFQEAVASNNYTWVTRKKGIGYGYSDSTYWIRFSLRNYTDELLTLVLESEVYWISFMELYRGNGALISQAGIGKPFLKRTHFYHKPLFQITLNPKVQETYYLRVKDRGTMLFFIRMWKANEFRYYDTLRSLGYGVFYGIEIAVILSSFLLSFSIRDKSIAVYGVHVFFSLLSQISFLGLGFAYLWKESLWFVNRGDTVLFSIGVVTSILFLYLFKKDQLSERSQHYLLGFMFFLVLEIVFLLFWTDPRHLVPLVVNSALFIYICSCLILLVSFVKKFDVSSLLITLGFSIFSFSVVIGGGVVLGQVPVSEWTFHAPTYGRFVEIIFLTVAIVISLRQIKHQKEVAESIIEDQKVSERYMAGGFAHEIRNAVSSPKMMVSKVLDTGVCKYDSEQLKSIFQKIYSALNRVFFVTSQISSYEKLGSFVPGTDKVNIRKFIGGVIEDLRINLEENNVQCINIVNEFTFMEVDPNHLQSIVQNLLLNSITALKGKSKEEFCEINISSYEKSAFFYLVFVDNGKGMNKETQDQIFYPFFSKSQQGVGLGMTVVKKLTELYEGEISVSSEEGDGTTFILKFKRFV